MNIGLGRCCAPYRSTRFSRRTILQLPHAFSDDIVQLRKNMAKLEEELKAKASDTGGRADRDDGASP
jgi:hypothetical protein